MPRLIRVQWVAFALLLALCALASVVGPAFAQAAPDTAAVGVDAALGARQLMLERAKLRHAQASPAPASADTPPPPVSESDVSKPGFLGKPLTYSIDLSAMMEGGPTHWPGGLPGGMDASLLYKLDRTTRVAAYYYQFSANQLGTDDDIPVVFQGTTTPIGYVNGLRSGFDTTTHLRFQIYSAQQMFFVSGNHNPLILAPVYGSIRSSIAGNDDTGTIFANDRILTNVHERSYQFKALNLVIPLFYGEKYLISYTGAAIWNNNINGANLTNHPQYQQAGYLMYQPNPETTLFANIEKAITYFPTEVYPYHTPTFHYGISKTIKAPFWIEAEVSTGGPSNPNYTNDIGRVGIVDLTVPCTRTAAGGTPSLTCVALAQNGVAVPVAGAAKYTTFTVMFGFGANPLVRPF